MATVAYGTATFTIGGSETSVFTWTNALTGAPVVYSVAPTVVFGPCQIVASGGAGIPYIDGAGAITTTGGTVTMANPGNIIVIVTAIGS